MNHVQGFSLGLVLGAALRHVESVDRIKRTLTRFCVLTGLVLLSAAPTQAVSGGVDPKARLATAEAMFAERCKKSGEFIRRTVENVDGILLMKVRPKGINYGDQFKMDDPYGHDSSGENYLKTFFSGFYRNSKTPPPGYAYVEAIDPLDGKRYRYVGRIGEVSRKTSVLMGGDGKTEFKTKDFVLDRALAAKEAPRYGVTYDDISTREEREYWIAGSSLKVVDLKTNEVIAERIGYMMDWAQGSRAGFRSPWLLAADHACPRFPVAPGNHVVQTDQTRKFVTKILKPKLENQP